MIYSRTICSVLSKSPVNVLSFFMIKKIKMKDKGKKKKWSPSLRLEYNGTAWGMVCPRWGNRHVALGHDCGHHINSRGEATLMGGKSLAQREGGEPDVCAMVRSTVWLEHRRHQFDEGEC